ncbi:MAG: GNAT family N-acetyltransferase [Motilibacteraceae bacterium]
MSSSPTADVSVRPARAGDAPALGAVQAAVWRRAYADVLPAEVLESLDAEDLAEPWRQAVVAPPSPRHRVLVALAGADVVGFAAVAPSEDDDVEPMVDAEVLALLVAPEAAGAGHGSRLLQAVVDVLAGDGFRHAHVWLGAGDAPLRTFLEGAGWAADGSTRTLDLTGDASTVVEQERLHTRIVDEDA